jgi:hypothetical protein
MPVGQAAGFGDRPTAAGLGRPGPETRWQRRIPHRGGRNSSLAQVKFPVRRLDADTDVDPLSGSTNAIFLGGTFEPTPSTAYVDAAESLYLEPLGFSGAASICDMVGTAPCEAPLQVLTTPELLEFGPASLQDETDIVNAVEAEYERPSQRRQRRPIRTVRLACRVHTGRPVSDDCLHDRHRRGCRLARGLERGPGRRRRQRLRRPRKRFLPLLHYPRGIPGVDAGGDRDRRRNDRGHDHDHHHSGRLRHGTLINDTTALVDAFSHGIVDSGAFTALVESVLDLFNPAYA